MVKQSYHETFDLTFDGTLDMLLIDCEINQQLTSSANRVINNATGAGTLAITNSRLYLLQ